MRRWLLLLPILALLLSGCVMAGPEQTANGTGALCGGTATGSSASLSEEQNSNARAIAAAASTLGLSEVDTLKATQIGIVTALTESTLKAVNYGDTMNGAMTSSRGLFQQMAPWGPLADRLDPTKSALMFFNGGAAGQQGLLDIPNWQSMTVPAAAQAVEKSQFADGSNYLKNMEQGLAIAAGLTLSSPVCSSPTGPGGTPNPYTGSVDAAQTEADPTGTGGKLTKATVAAYNAIKVAKPFLSASCWDAHAWNPTSDHPKGRACDIYYGQSGVYLNKVNPAAWQKTWDAVNWMTTNATALNISYIIWDGKYWNGTSWGPYSSSVYDVANDPVGGHYDHVHVSVKGGSSQ